MPNRLQDEYSPYLQQHAENPVDWHPWGEEAFSKATRENKSIFLSIGYSSCHWCHVMERESFMDEKIAQMLNENFISIKVDREERPDIDKHFQDVYQLMNGRPGGWPTSLFLTDELKPFYAATYIPPEPRYGMMAFGELLETIAIKYSRNKEALVEKSDEIVQFLHPKKEKIEATKLDSSIIKRFEEQAVQLFDGEGGGFGKAPKFPQVSTLSLLLDIYQLTKNTESLDMVEYTLKSLSRGGFYDRVDGGFCRYSTDESWLVPHFEKMTYDNALLSELFLKVYNITEERYYRDRAFETIDFMLSKMSEEYLFYSASDADTQGVEGKYFVYGYHEALDAFSSADIPSDQHEILAQALGITPQGNFEGSNIVRVEEITSIDDPYYSQAILALQKIREGRIYPFIDKKVQVSWSAMMIKSLFKASRIDESYLPMALKSLDKLLESMYIDGQLYHTTLMGRPPKIKAFLEDYAYLGDALIEAYETTHQEVYLITAVKLTNSAIENCFERGIWKFSRGEFETDASKHDSSYPSAMATMLDLLLSVSSLVDPVYKKFVHRTLEINSYDIMRQPIATPKMSRAVIRYLQDDIIIKAASEKLKKHQRDYDKIPYPFSYTKVDTNDGFMICTSSSCFGHEGDWEGLLAVLERR